jgi:hypothetical protein
MRHLLTSLSHLALSEWAICFHHCAISPYQNESSSYLTESLCHIKMSHLLTLLSHLVFSKWVIPLSKWAILLSHCAMLPFQIETSPYLTVPCRHIQMRLLLTLLSHLARSVWAICFPPKFKVKNTICSLSPHFLLQRKAAMSTILKERSLYLIEKIRKAVYNVSCLCNSSIWQSHCHWAISPTH